MVRDGGDAGVEGEAGAGGDSLAAPHAACAPATGYTAVAWPEADALFRREPRWLGGDAAYSVELAPGRILWLFGDSFIAKTDAHVRSASTLVRNSVAIQTGTDPTTSTIAFHWRDTDGTAASFFPEEGARWFWPVHGARIGGELVLFLTEVERVDGGLGFDTVGSRMVRIANPDASPLDWSIATRTLPRDGRSHGVGVVRAGDFLYSLTREHRTAHAVELERWSAGALDGDSSFWNGSAFGPAASSVSIWTDGAPEMSTAARCGEWINVESVGFGATDLAIRRARSLAGPWSDAVKVFQPEESRREKPFVYAGKHHPGLTGADIVTTYVANSFDFADLFADTTLYYPRFVKITEQR
ncbi:MAG: DUF4185 domain-containing protein [Labilithrix sp.]|nr:DUF4185 domain-containing protein [Labilithrix sp.]MCW5817707.1 DUF4185 domain-containing protein [Labilithrix sp.]